MGKRGYLIIGGILATAVLLSVLFYTMLANHRPAGQPLTIEELLITKDRHGHCYLKKSGTEYLVGQGQSYDIEVVANTSIELSYRWSVDGGELSGEGSLVTWTAPNTPGKVTITVTVSDIAGRMASKNLVLRVVPCSPCIRWPCAK